MARSSVTVEGFLEALDPDRRAQVEAIRGMVREAHPDVVEGIRWIAPSWVLHGEDRVTVNTVNKQRLVRLVLHMGTARAEDRKAPPVLDDPAGLVAWSSDIRGLLTFADLPDLEARREAVVDVLRRWLALPVRP